MELNLYFLCTLLIFKLFKLFLFFSFVFLYYLLSFFPLGIKCLHYYTRIITLKKFWNVTFIFIELIALHSGIADPVIHVIFPRIWSKVDFFLHFILFYFLLSVLTPQPAIKCLYYYIRMIVLGARGDLGPQVPRGLIKPITCRSSLIICWRSLSIIR